MADHRHLHCHDLQTITSQVMIHLQQITLQMNVMRHLVAGCWSCFCDSLNVGSHGIFWITVDCVLEGFSSVHSPLFLYSENVSSNAARAIEGGNRFSVFVILLILTSFFLESFFLLQQPIQVMELHLSQIHNFERLKSLRVLIICHYMRWISMWCI